MALDEFDRRADRMASWMLEGPAAVVLWGVALLHLECWSLSYLGWPWSPDHDVFATLARSWDAGVLPYRDMEANNPPATIYLYWVLGKLFGWGRTTPFFAFDAALTASLGVIMLAWSRRRFRSSLPAAVGYLWFLRYYLGLDYSMTGQRDWHASLAAAAAMMVADAWSGHRGRWVSAFLAALAVAVRPQALLLAPAFVAVANAKCQSLRTPQAEVGRAAFQWGLIFTGVLALMFFPLMATGILGDFVHDFHRAAYSGLRAAWTIQDLVERSLNALWRWEFLAVLISAFVLTCHAESYARRSIAAWIAAQLATILYKAISPQQHNYLDIPQFLFMAISLSVVLGTILQTREVPAAFRLAVVFLSLGVNGHASLYTIQPHGNMQWSFASFDEMRRGREPLVYPNGYSGEYSLKDYQALIEYLSIKDPNVTLANALAYPLALTGPTARLSAFPAESLAWLMLVRPDDESAFVEKLEQTPNSMVVWIPAEFERPLAPFDRLEQAIRKLYELDARVGPFEIWRRAQ
jgi:hypothetical protein